MSGDPAVLSISALMGQAAAPVSERDVSSGPRPSNVRERVEFCICALEVEINSLPSRRNLRGFESSHGFLSD